jgi:hypothetical protein
MNEISQADNGVISLPIGVGTRPLLVFTYHFGPVDTFARHIQNGTSPDSALTVQVYRKKTRWFCMDGCIDVD